MWYIRSVICTYSFLLYICLHEILLTFLLHFLNFLEFSFKYAKGEKAVAIYSGLYGILGLNLSPTPTATHLCWIVTVVDIFWLLCHFTTKHKLHSLCNTQLGGVSLLWRKHIYAKWHQGLPTTKVTFTRMKTYVTRKLDLNLMKKPIKYYSSNMGF
jgi:hypothetical protein